ncbi:hypothetical protein [Paenibacillus campi]|uniref:hypothetical protein n=1 Tax=Paenibacillus campi TaxID=3106031 RepID=UPI002AFE33D0|nr:hypothetical protein [Paenibacillus sp. SGZ-1009]
MNTIRRTVGTNVWRSRVRLLWHRMADARGAVTIFMIVVLAGVFMFTAVFIDYARIAAMQVQAERLTHTLVRSVMSAYEPEFQIRYGLFAFGASNAASLLDTAVADNLSYTDIDNSFNLIPLQIDKTSIAMSRPLGKYDVFNGQVQEEMKYKAPIDFTVEVVEKLRGMSAIMKETTQTVDVLNAVRIPYEKREQAINDLIALQKNTALDVHVLAKMVMYPASNSIASRNIGSIQSLADIAAQFADYASKISEDQKRKKKKKSALYTEKIANYQSNAASLIDKVMPKTNALMITHESTYKQAVRLMQTIREQNQKIATIIKQARSRSANASYDRVSTTRTPGSTNGSANASAEAQIAELRKNLDQLVLSDELMQRMETNYTSQHADYAAIKDAIRIAVGEAQQQIRRTSGSTSVLASRTIAAAHLLQTYRQAYMGKPESPSGALGKIEHDIDTARAGTDTVAANEQKAKQSMQKATALIATITALGAGATAANVSFDEVDRYYESNLEFNKGTGGTTATTQSLNSDPYDESQQSMGAMDMMFGGVSDVLMKSRNEFFMNEYAIHYFEPFDVMMWGNLLDSVKQRDASLAGDFPINDVSNSGSAQEALTMLTIDQQQLEYIIYGFNGPVANLTAAYSEIFGVRLAIRIAEGLVKNARLGHPLAVLAAGIAYGAERAVLDMIDLFSKGYTNLSDYWKVEFAYRDYLRLFLLQTNKEQKMSRMLALIRYNTQINPQERDTYATASVHTGMKIWFLPGITNMLQSGYRNSSVEQGVYYADQQADYSY